MLRLDRCALLAGIDSARARLATAQESERVAANLALPAMIRAGSDWSSAAPPRPMQPSWRWRLPCGCCSTVKRRRRWLSARRACPRPSLTDGGYVVAELAVPLRDPVFIKTLADVRLGASLGPPGRATV